MSHLAFATTVIRNLLSRPATRLYPFVKRAPLAGSRGAIRIDIEKCSMCSLCQKRCPCEAITVKRAERIWEIDHMRCIWCGACVEACPRHCLSMANTYTPVSLTKSIESHQQQTPPAKPEPAVKA